MRGPVTPTASRLARLAPALALVMIAAWSTWRVVGAGAGVPDDAAWGAAAARVRAQHQPGELIVFAPGWVEPVGYLHLGDLVPVEMAARLDAARYPVIWELSIRGARAPATRGLRADATADNGCMYVVPAPWDLQYWNPNASAEILSLQTVRALPAAAGAVLGWTPKLLHWGALARPGAPPRVSLSIEYQRADRPPIEATTAPLDDVPAPGARRALIVEQWHRYRHMHDQPEAALAALTGFLDRALPA